VPFLDRTFIDVAMNLDPEVKLSGKARGRIEKQFLREAFAGYLPDSVLWRQKEQFSDGVGYSWIDSLKAHAAQQVSDQELESARFRFPYNTPLTKEAYFYRTLFEKHFPQPWAAQCVPGGPSVACSTAAALEWDASLKNVVDPSGRAVQSVHNAAY
jgi:asparagine synthase (glutamine-hydrolysing)